MTIYLSQIDKYDNYALRFLYISHPFILWYIFLVSIIWFGTHWFIGLFIGFIAIICGRSAFTAPKYLMKSIHYVDDHFKIEYLIYSKRLTENVHKDDLNLILKYPYGGAKPSPYGNPKLSFIFNKKRIKQYALQGFLNLWSFEEIRDVYSIIISLTNPSSNRKDNSAFKRLKRDLEF